MDCGIRTALDKRGWGKQQRKDPGFYDRAHPCCHSRGLCVLSLCLSLSLARSLARSFTLPPTLLPSLSLSFVYPSLSPSLPFSNTFITNRQTQTYTDRQRDTGTHTNTHHKLTNSHTGAYFDSAGPMFPSLGSNLARAYSLMRERESYDIKTTKSTIYCELCFRFCVMSSYHLEQDSIRQATMEGIGGGLHPAMDEQRLS